MFIEKNGEVYAVKENLVTWTIIAPCFSENEEVTFSVRKVDCGTFEALTDFVWANSAF
jgi:hypothetical protein